MGATPWRMMRLYGHQQPLSLSSSTPCSPTRGAPVTSSNLMEGRVTNPSGKLHLDFSLRSHGHEPLYYNTDRIPLMDHAKFLGMHLDKRLTYKPHVRLKRLELNLRLGRLRWLLCPKSTLSLVKRKLIYISILLPVWMYGIQLWGCTANSNRQPIQSFQNIVVQLITGSPWFVCRHSSRRPPAAICRRYLPACSKARGSSPPPPQYTGLRIAGHHQHSSPALSHPPCQSRIIIVPRLPT